MSNQSNQKVDRLVSNQMTVFISALFVFICGGINLFFTPIIFAEFFFLYQLIVRYVAYFRVRTESRFIEVLFTSPAKLLTALLMVQFGMPKDNISGIAWIVFALLFVASGLRGLYNVMRVAKANQDDTTKFENMVTAVQRKKEVKVEDALLDDLSKFLNQSNPEDK